MSDFRALLTKFLEILIGAFEDNGDVSDLVTFKIFAQIGPYNQLKDVGDSMLTEEIAIKERNVPHLRHHQRLRKWLSQFIKEGNLDKLLELIWDQTDEEFHQQFWKWLDSICEAARNF